MDKLLFRQAVDSVTRTQSGQDPSAGIGTLGEKTLHSVLKQYFECDKNRHEVKLDGFVADIAADDKIIEIQTRHFDKLRRKLTCFLTQYDVTIVYPVARTKWLIWIDDATGECTKRRKSPKTGKLFEVLRELYKIKSMLCDRHLCICIVLIDLVEYRYLNGWSQDGKKGSTRHERIPIDIADEIYIKSPADYIKLIPATLPDSFTSKEYKAATGLSQKAAQTALNVLHAVNAVIRTGKSGNAYVYERSAGCRKVSCLNGIMP